MATKDNKENGIFSLVPSRVATFPSPSQPSSTSQTDAICNPDSFSDLFRLLGEWGGREGGREPFLCQSSPKPVRVGGDCAYPGYHSEPPVCGNVCKIPLKLPLLLLPFLLELLHSSLPLSPLSFFLPFSFLLSPSLTYISFLPPSFPLLPSLTPSPTPP